LKIFNPETNSYYSSKSAKAQGETRRHLKIFWR